MLFASLYVPSRLSEAVSDAAWIAAMLQVEAALARAEARAGVIPMEAAEAIEASCRPDRIDNAAIVAEARKVGNPAEPLVRALQAQVPAEFAGYVHLGATSQDIVDTAAMLVTRGALAIGEEAGAEVARTLARLAETHRHTLMAGRTLLQQALPITFGLKAAGWLAGISRALAALRRLRDEALAVQLGGAAGTLASLRGDGVAVLAGLATELDLAEPALPWHAERTRLAEIGAALALAAGAAEKVALDIVLLAQTEVGEVSERSDGRRGGSSTLPHKHNPVAAVLARACARDAQAAAETLMRAVAQEHERAAGAWQAEWPALSTALAATGGAISWLRDSLDGLEIHTEQMRENLDATHGLIMSEQAAGLLTERVGREQAHDLVRRLGVAAAGSSSLEEQLLEDRTVRQVLTEVEIERAMDPGSYLGAADSFIDRALARYGAESP